MKSRLDEIFSPDRLRERWSDEPAVPQDVVAPQVPPPPAHPTRLAERLAELTESRFAAARNPALQALTEALREQVAARFPVAPRAPLPAEELSCLEAQIEGLIDQIEDLMDALELGGRR